MKAWTDYPFTWLGDTEGQEAPVREIEVLSFDGDKYCRINVCGEEDEIKAGYIYQREGRYGAVPQITRSQLALLTDNAGDHAARRSALTELLGVSARNGEKKYATEQT